MELQAACAITSSLLAVEDVSGCVEDRLQISSAHKGFMLPVHPLTAPPVIPSTI